MVTTYPDAPGSPEGKSHPTNRSWGRSNAESVMQEHYRQVIERAQHRKGHIYRVEDTDGNGHYVNASSSTSAVTLVAIALHRDRDAFRVVSKLNPATHKLEHRYK